MFRDREDAAEQLVLRFKGRALRDPLVLAIPRGGIVLGAVLARALGADLDVVLSRKLRALDEPEVAIGAISESGEVYLNHFADAEWGVTERYLAEERRHQLAEIARLKQLFRAVRPQASIANRSVIVTDDGIATGSTMIAALKTVQSQSPYELIVAVPVASPTRLAAVRKLCDEIVCLERPDFFWSIGEFYDDFSEVDNEEVVRLLRECAATAAASTSMPGT